MYKITRLSDGEVFTSPSLSTWYYKMPERAITKTTMQKAQYILLDGTLYHPIQFQPVEEEMIDVYELVSIEIIE